MKAAKSDSTTLTAGTRVEALLPGVSPAKWKTGTIVEYSYDPACFSEGVGAPYLPAVC